MSAAVSQLSDALGSVAVATAIKVARPAAELINESGHSLGGMLQSWLDQFDRNVDDEESDR